MGLRDRLRFAASVATRPERTERAEETFAASPIIDWSSLDPSIFGIASYSGVMNPDPRISRAEAIQVGAVKRARDLIAGTLGTLPLYAIDSDNVRFSRPLLEQPERHIPRSVTINRTIEDMIFEGGAWWRVVERDATNFRPTKVVRLEPTTVNVQQDQRVYVRRDGTQQGSAWEHVPDADLIHFPSPNDPLLVAGARAIRTALKLDRAAQRYADEPQMQGYFTAKEGADPDNDKVQETLNGWKAARQARVTGYVPSWLAYVETQGWAPEQMQLVEARNFAVTEIARVVGLDPADLGAPVTSDTYKNAVDRRMALQDFTFAPYAVAFTDRLSMDDVTPRGYKIRFDFGGFTRSDEKSRMETYQVGLEIGAYDLAEVQRREELPAPMDVPALPQQIAQEADMPNLTFSDSSSRLHLAFDSADLTFSVDEETRVVTGLAVPWGTVAKKGLRKFKFERGSLKWADISRVKLLRDHDNSQPVGKAIALEDTEAGLVAKFKIGRGRAGDEVLALAADGVLDGLSIGVDFTVDGVTPDPVDKSTVLVQRAALREVSILAYPAFDGARVMSVAASEDEGISVMPDATTEPQAPAAPAAASAVDFSALTEALTGALTDGFATLRDNLPPVVPAAAGARFVSEPVPYRFDRGGNFTAADHEFSSDLVAMLKSKDSDGTGTEAGKRVMGLLQAKFATVATDDINELNPNIQRPDMYVDQRDYKTPLWDMINKGAPPNGVQPFTFPKFSSSSGLVGDHTEETEPTAGTFVTTSQTVTPTALSGKASITRETWDMGGNPAVSTLIFNQMRRGYFEGLESATATFLNTLTAATDLAVTTAAADKALAASLEGHLSGLQFVRGYDFSAFAVEKVLYQALAAAVDDNGNPIYPILNPGNRNGTAAARFRTLDVAGITAVPSWALASTPGSANNSWLFDPSTVSGWATAPQRLEFAGTAGDGSYAPTAFIDLAVWGYKAFANSDIAGVRQVTYDSVA